MGNEWLPLFLQLWVKLYYFCFSTGMALALDNLRRLICHLARNSNFFLLGYIFFPFSFSFFFFAFIFSFLFSFTYLSLILLLILFLSFFILNSYPFLNFSFVFFSFLISSWQKSYPAILNIYSEIRLNPLLRQFGARK